MKRILLIYICISLLLSACGAGTFGSAPTPTLDPCGSEALESPLDEIESLVRRFEDGRELAEQTARISLSDPIADLQAVQRDTESLDMPPCLNEARAALVAYMDATIDGFLGFMGEDEDAVIAAKWLTAADAYQTYIDAMNQHLPITWTLAFWLPLLDPTEEIGSPVSSSDYATLTNAREISAAGRAGSNCKLQ